MYEQELSIVVPTYNRKEKLIQTVKKILPQISCCKLIIIDNYSDEKVIDYLQEVILKYEYKDNVEIYRNKENIGACGNLLRTYEVANSNWMWLLSDDDIPLDDAVDIILDDIKKYHDNVFLNYASELYMRKKDIECTGLNDFIEKMDSFSNVLFMSSGVYNIKKILPYLRYGYLFSYSMAPHFVLILMAINNGGKIILRNDRVVKWGMAEKKEQWSNVTLSLNLSTVLEVPINLDEKHFKILAKHLNTHIVSPARAFKNLLLNQSVQTYKVQWITRQIKFRKYQNYQNWSIRDFVKYIIGWNVIILPLCILKIIRKYFCANNQDDLFNRL